MLCCEADVWRPQLTSLCQSRSRATWNIHQSALKSDAPFDVTEAYTDFLFIYFSCRDVPLIRNSLNSQFQIALAERGRIPGDATAHSYCTSTPTAPTSTSTGKEFCSRLVCCLPHSRSGGGFFDMHMDPDDDWLSHASCLPQSWC